ncbi:mandelate racemase/muconate lactonizing enzyme family protein [Candidatus Latescibacterota bacterium]
MNTNYVNRRDFLKSAGIGSIAAMGTGFLPEAAKAAIDKVGPMKISKIEAVRFKSDFQIAGKRAGTPWTWVRLYTDTGLVGVGEAYVYTDAEIGALKSMAFRIIGKDATNIEKLWRELYFRSSQVNTGGAEMRIISAVNMAQWDILGKAAGMPVYKLLGGKSQEKLRIYNTYIRNREINGMTLDKDAEKITKFLLDMGIRAIKIYPYEEVGRKTEGNYISPADVDKCLDWTRRIRETAGNEMDIAIDVMCRWNLPCAVKIAHSLEPYNIMFIEDMILPDNPESYSVLARETSIPVCASERIATRYEFRGLLESKAIDIAMFDLSWCGGISSAKKIADLADLYYIPIAPHDFEGPIAWVSAMHVATAATNFFILESCYPRYMTTYPYFFKNTPQPVDGYITPPDGPGLGLEFREEPFKSGNAIVETIAEI